MRRLCLVLSRPGSGIRMLSSMLGSHPMIMWRYEPRIISWARELELIEAQGRVRHQCMLVDIRYPTMWKECIADWVSKKKPAIIHYIRSNIPELTASILSRLNLNNPITRQERVRTPIAVFDDKQKEVRDSVEEFSKRIDRWECPSINVFYEDITGGGDTYSMPERVSNLILNFLRLPHRELSAETRKTHQSIEEKIETY